MNDWSRLLSWNLGSPPTGGLLDVSLSEGLECSHGVNLDCLFTLSCVYRKPLGTLKRTQSRITRLLTGRGRGHLYYKPGKPLSGATLYVARLTRSGGVGMARPCRSCWDLIRDQGIKDVVYTTNEGTWKRELLTKS